MSVIDPKAPVAPAKVEAPKTAAPAPKAEPVKAAAPAKKPAAKKAVAKKPAAKKAAPAKKAEAPKAAAKKAAPAKKAAAKKPAAKKVTPSAKKVDVVLQGAGNEWNMADVEKKVIKAMGKAVKSLTIYVKPEEGMAYFVADGETGEVNL